MVFVEIQRRTREQLPPAGVHNLEQLGIAEFMLRHVDETHVIRREDTTDDFLGAVDQAPVLALVDKSRPKCRC